MTILFDVDIIAAVERGNIAITDFDDSEGGPLGANSYDLRVGQFFYEVIWGRDGPWYVGPIVVAEGQSINVPVGGTLLAMTHERVTTKGKITGIMKSRSTTGREGIAVCKCASLGDVGYDNHWTMILTALVSQGQPVVTVGERISQIVFFEGKSEPRSPYSGQYCIEGWPLCMVPQRWRHRIIPHIECAEVIAWKSE
jgi:dCTP deaminase